MKCAKTICQTLFPVLCLGLGAGCGGEAPPSFTRLHMENSSGAPVTFFAIGISEREVEGAPNRLLQPLEPDSVFSALLTRPGNYWVRAEFESGGHVIERIEGPMRVSHGVSDWQFNTLDVRPLYEGHDAKSIKTPAPPLLQNVALAHRAGRMSFSSN